MQCDKILDNIKNKIYITYSSFDIINNIEFNKSTFSLLYHEKDDYINLHRNSHLDLKNFLSNCNNIDKSYIRQYTLLICLDSNIESDSNDGNTIVYLPHETYSYFYEYGDLSKHKDNLEKLILNKHMFSETCEKMNFLIKE